MTSTPTPTVEQPNPNQPTSQHLCTTRMHARTHAIRQPRHESKARKKERKEGRKEPEREAAGQPNGSGMPTTNSGNAHTTPKRGKAGQKERKRGHDSQQSTRHCGLPMCCASSRRRSCSFSSRSRWSSDSTSSCTDAAATALSTARCSQM